MKPPSCEWTQPVQLSHFWMRACPRYLAGYSFSRPWPLKNPPHPPLPAKGMRHNSAVISRSLTQRPSSNAKRRATNDGKHGHDASPSIHWLVAPDAQWRHLSTLARVGAASRSRYNRRSFLIRHSQIEATVRREWAGFHNDRRRHVTCTVEHLHRHSVHVG